MPIKNPVEWMVAQLDAGAALGSATPAEYWQSERPLAGVREIGVRDLAFALRAGFKDFAAARTDVVFMCMIYPVMGLLLVAVAGHAALLPLLFPLALGFVLVGPAFAVGLYEMSRQRELTGAIAWGQSFKVLRSPSIWSLLAMGGLLLVVFALWLAVAQAIYDVTLGPAAPVSITSFMLAVLTTPAGWAMTGAGLLVGAGFALCVLAMAVVSFPLMLDRPVGFGAAIATSILAVRRNKGVMMLWGLLVAGALLLGAVPFLLGLVVVLPVLGHATWHLYRRLVRG